MVVATNSGHHLKNTAKRIAAAALIAAVTLALAACGDDTGAGGSNAYASADSEIAAAPADNADAGAQPPTAVETPLEDVGGEALPEEPPAGYAGADDAYAQAPAGDAGPGPDVDYSLSMTSFQVTEEIEITIAWVTDWLLGLYEEFVMPEVSGEHRIAFIANVPVANFRFIEINGAEVWFVVERDLYSLDALLPDRPFVANWLPAGSIELLRNFNFARASAENAALQASGWQSGRTSCETYGVSQEV